MVNARVGRCVYGAADAKAGALGSLYDLNADSRLNHRFNVTAGVLADECRELLSSYFGGLRGAGGADGGCGADLEAHAAHAAGARSVPKMIAVARRLTLALRAAGPAVCCWRSTPLRAACRVHGRRRRLPRACAVCGPMPRCARCRWRMAARERSTPSPRAAVRLSTCEVAGPLGDRVSAQMLVDDERDSAVIEMAEAAGIGYSSCTESAALAASTYGVGELMLRAVRARAQGLLYIGSGRQRHQRRWRRHAAGAGRARGR